jgi:hypothetical protein
MGESCALAIYPALELGRVLQEETVEKITSVQFDRAGTLTVSERVLEFSEVRPNDARIQPQLVPGGEDSVIAQRSAQRVHGLFEKISRVWRIALGPQICDELVATHTVSMRSKKRHETEPVSLNSRTGDRSALALER